MSEIIEFKQGWHSYREVSIKLGYETDMIEAIEKEHGIFVWSPVFSNVHVGWYYEEPQIIVDGETFPHTEAYFQSMKSFGTVGHKQAKEEIKRSQPIDAYYLGRNYLMRKDWDTIKASVMKRGVREKFKDSLLRSILLDTENYPIVQLKACSTWGSGTDGKGDNLLGAILMDLRKEIRSK
jgi:ribA/ribD-fused uncharacterized protein